jgi:hypothetical protein
LANANSATLCNTLLTGWGYAIFMGVAMVHDQHRLSDQDIPLNVNTVLGGHLTPGTDASIVIDYDNGFPILFRRSCDMENCILPDLDGITKLDSVRSGPSPIAGMMNGQVPAKRRKRIGQTHPKAIQSGEHLRKKPQGVFYWRWLARRLHVSIPGRFRRHSAFA